MGLNTIVVLVVILCDFRLSASLPPSNAEFSQSDQTIFSSNKDKDDDVKRLDVTMLLDTIAELKEQMKLLQDTVNEVREQEARNDEPAQLRMDETGVKSFLKYGDGKKRSRRASGQGYPSVSGPGSGCSHPGSPYYREGGVACPPCATGPPGPPGSPGVPGPMGRDGRDGRDSISGFLKGDVEEDVTPSVPMQESNQISSGAIYVRWGHNTCPSTSELVYTGIAGGSFYSHKGSGSNYLCLPEEPIYDETESSVNSERGRIYGGEYQTSRSNAFPPFSDLHQHDVPCAVCKASNRPSLLMVPARNVCPNDSWTKEYHGYLMSARSSHYRSEYICVVRDPQAVPRTSADNNGALFYLVEGICTNGGGLPCGPYINGYELTCAVCTV